MASILRGWTSTRQLTNFDFSKSFPLSGTTARDPLHSHAMSGTNSTVSVIIPTFNRAAFLREALDSVFAQTVQPCEVIVVDDGSKDNTESVVKEMQAAHPSLRYLPQKNAGPAAARNTGMKAATGHWLAFLDSDDLWVSDKLERQLAYAAKHPNIGMIFGAMENIGPSGKLTDARADHWVAQTNPRTNVDDPFALVQAIMDNPIGTPTVLLKRDAVRVNGFMDEKLRYAEDLDYWIRMILATPAAFLPGVVLRRRIHGGNLVSDWIKVNEAVLTVLEMRAATTRHEIFMSQASVVAYDLGSVYLKNFRFKDAARAFGRVSPGHMERRNKAAFGVKRVLAAMLRPIR